MAFRVGQKVVCVDASNQCACGCTVGLQKGGIYTVTKVIMDGAGIFVAESDPSVWRNGYAVTRFRPVVSTDTGMAILEQIRRDVTNKTALPIREDEQV
jgi:hypothetical protein